jgi:hypothetical protein
MIEYTAKCTLDGLISPSYFGYMSRLMGNTAGRTNDPQNFAEDFPAHISPRNITRFMQIDDKKNEIPEGYYSVELEEFPIFEKCILNRKWLRIYSGHSQNMMMALATVFRNLELRGSCMIRWEYCDELYDWIKMLKASFAEVYIGPLYLECNGFFLKDVEKVMNYFRYALDCPGTIYPYTAVPDSDKLNTIFEKLK